MTHDSACSCQESLCGDCSLHGGDDQCFCVCEPALRGTAMTHDPLCPYSQPCPEEWRNARLIAAEGLPVPHRIVSGSGGSCVQCSAGECVCDLIDKVRTNQEVETLSDVADAAILFLGYTGDEVRKLTVDALDMLRNSR